MSSVANAQGAARPRRPARPPRPSPAQRAAARKERIAALWEQARELGRPFLVYWIFLGLMFGAFCVAAMIDGPSAEGVMVLGVLGLVTVTSVAFGQVLALLRVRDWVLFMGWFLTWTLGSLVGCMGAAAVAGAVPFLAMLMFCYVFFGPMFAIGGAFSLKTNRAIFACWVPLIYASGTAIIMAESKGKIGTWIEGNKWAVWDFFTFSVLGVGIALLLAFLVARETHRLWTWRRSPLAPLMASFKEKGAARPRLSCLGWMMLCMLAGVLAVGTAAVAPFLWRTAPAEDGEPCENCPPKEDPGEKPNEGDEGGKEGDGGDEPKEKVEDVIEEIKENLQPSAEQTLDLLTTLLTALLLLLLALFVFYRPVRRLLMVRHFKRPFWKVSATTRIEHGWNLVEIAMGDAGLPPRPGEAAVSLARRSGATLERLAPGRAEVHGLEDAAAIRDRVVYGLGVGPDDLAFMDRVSTWAFDTVWDRLGDGGQIKALYRGL